MLTLEIKVNRLFELGHSREQPERTTDDVVRAVSQRIGRALDPTILIEIRAGQQRVLPVEVSEALCDEFGVERLYLREDDNPEVTRIDLLIQLWILIRDRALHHIAARGHDLDVETLKDLITLLEETAPLSASPAGCTVYPAGA